MYGLHGQMHLAGHLLRAGLASAQEDLFFLIRQQGEVSWGVASGRETLEPVSAHRITPLYHMISGGSITPGSV